MTSCDMATNQTILELLKTDLEKMNITPPQQRFLEALIESAKTQIEREGIVLDLASTDDLMTVSMYAAYLYRRRAVADNGMPRMLRYRLNNRLLEQKSSPEGLYVSAL